MPNAVIALGYPGLERPISNSLRANFPMHWLVGEDDHTGPGGNTGDDDYNALYAAHDGHDYYKALGMKTIITELPDTGHADAFPPGSGILPEDP